MGEPIVLTRMAGADDGFRVDLPLERELAAEPVTVDARQLGSWHPMFALRLRLFIDWHLAAGHEVRILPPDDGDTAQQSADLGVADGLQSTVITLPAPRVTRQATVLPLRRFRDFNEVEELARETVGLLERQSEALGVWGNALFAAVSELCNNAIQHGRNELGGYIVAAYITEKVF